MSKPGSTFRSFFTPRIPSKSLFLLLLVLLLTFTATALAQEDTGEAEVPEMLVLSQTELPYGVQTVVRAWAIQDTYIASGQPDTNYGTSQTMRMGYQAPSLQAMRSLIQFDLSGIPSTAQVNSATMSIYQTNSNPVNDAPMGFKAQYMTAPWNQYSATWRNANYLGGATIGIGQNTSALGWKQSNVTDLVRSWVSGSELNYGMIVTGDESPSNNRYRWFGTTDAGLRPFVDVDFTTCTDTTAPFASVNVLPAWSRGSFTVSWSGTDQGGSGIAYYNIQVSQNNGTWTTWLSHTTATSATYNGGNNQTYAFRAQAVDKCGNVQNWTGTQAWTKVDTVAPEASVQALPEYTLTEDFPVNWSGSDNPGGSGIRYFDVDVRVNDGDWLSWLRGVTSTSAVFHDAANLTTYAFRAWATDVAGNVQHVPTEPQAETLVVLEPFSIVLPISPPITSADSVTLNWEGATVQGTTIVTYELKYRFNSGPWSAAPLVFPGNQNSTVFDFPPNGDGRYDFEIRAINSIGQEESWTGVPEAFVILDQDASFRVRSYWPLMQSINPND